MGRARRRKATAMMSSWWSAPALGSVSDEADFAHGLSDNRQRLLDNRPIPLPHPDGRIVREPTQSSVTLSRSARKES